MILVRINLKVKSESHGQFAKVMRENIQKSREFAGCQSFDLLSHNQANSYMLYQEWESQEAFDAFRNSDYFKQSGGELFPLLDGNPDAAYYQAAPL